MAKLIQNNPQAVELQGKIWIYTHITQENHSALRSGFAGYPANPRWNVNKYRAWKQGIKWREDWKGGLLSLDSSNFQLISREELDRKEQIKSRSLKWRGNTIFAK